LPPGAPNSRRNVDVSTALSFPALRCIVSGSFHCRTAPSRHTRTCAGKPDVSCDRRVVALLQAVGSRFICGASVA
jgi:hypothetical protein